MNGMPTTTTTSSAEQSNDEKGFRSPVLSSSSRAHTRIIVCISRDIYAQTNPNDLRTMHDFGIEFIFDTCWCMILDEPIIPHNPLGLIMTNSGKYAHYGPGLTNRRFRFGSMYDCIYAARFGYAPTRSPMVRRDESNATEAMKSSASIPESKLSKHTIDPYLSFLLRPSIPRNNLSDPLLIRRTYSTSTIGKSTSSSFQYSSRSVNVPKRRMLTATTFEIGVRTLSLLFKQCRR